MCRGTVFLSHLYVFNQSNNGDNTWFLIIFAICLVNKINRNWSSTLRRLIVGLSIVVVPRYLRYRPTLLTATQPCTAVIRYPRLLLHQDIDLISRVGKQLTNDQFSVPVLLRCHLESRHTYLAAISTHTIPVRRMDRYNELFNVN